MKAFTKGFGPEVRHYLTHVGGQIHIRSDEVLLILFGSRKWSVVLYSIAITAVFHFFKHTNLYKMSLCLVAGGIL